MRKVTLIIGVLSIIIMLSCGESGKKPFFQADISEIEKIEVLIDRYDKVLFEIDPNNLLPEIEPFVDDFRIFLGDEIYTQEGQEKLFAYITDSLNQIFYRDTKEVWPNVDLLQKGLSEAFRFYKYHFLEESTPDVYTYISGLDYKYPVKYDHNVLVIGLDMYLGNDYEWYPKVGIPSYLTFSMQPPFALIDVMKILGEKKLQQLSSVPESFLDFIVYEGKLLYFLDCMLPSTPDTLKIVYTSEQLEWLNKNVGMVWSFFLENELLFSSDRQTIIKFIGDAPFTAPFGKTSPPRTAAFIGWQIVREYMRKNRHVSLPQLLANTNSQEILTKSGYRPR